MDETMTFALIVLATSLAGLAAVLSNRLGEIVKVPLPAFFLAAAAIAKAVADLDTPPQRTVERVVTIALLLILFDGGAHIGWSRFRSAASVIVGVGVVGTFLTVAAAALTVHGLFGLDWYLAVLVGTAIAPTDPAVVFSVLGQRQIAGRSSTILEGESGANDPVGIALMTSLIAAGGLGVGAFEHVAGSFVLQMVVGAVIGVGGGRALLWTMRKMPLPSEALYPLRTLASVMIIYGIATIAHGSGFLAVFVAGIVVGDERVPYRNEIQRFHQALASLGEIVAFAVLGLTLDLSELIRSQDWVPGLVLGVVLAAVARPVIIGLCLLPARLRRAEQIFVAFAGLKGAVPILLGSFIVAADVPDAERIYGIVVVAVVFSVVVQGTAVPFLAARLRLPMRVVTPEPWALGVRLSDEPDGVHHMLVAAGAEADGATLDELPELPESVWVSLIVRDRHLVHVSGDTSLRAGDEVLILGDPDARERLEAIFGPAP